MNEILLMTKQNWINSQLSLARYYGGISINRRFYITVNALGEKVIPCQVFTDEPIDLIESSLLSFYRRLGRGGFISVLKDCGNTDLKHFKERLKQELENIKVKQNITTHKTLSLFSNDDF